MNNRDIVNIVGFMIMIIIIVIMYFFRYSSNSISNDIINKTWYRYDYTSGYYEKFIINKNKVSYYRPKNLNTLNEFDLCTKYNFNKKKNSFNMDCGKTIKIIDKNEKGLYLQIDNTNEMFYSNVEDTLNYEFESYFGKSILEYKKEKSQAKEFIRINSDKLDEVLSNDEYSKIIFIGDKCTSIDCVLALDIMEKWISKTENVYYFDISDINNNIINKLREMNKDLEIDDEFYNGIYPRVIISKNNRIVDQYEIKCIGFNCTNYYENEF